MKRAELLLFFTPILFFVGFGVLRVAQKRLNSPQLEVRSVLYGLEEGEEGKKDSLRVRVFVTCNGPKPRWWGRTASVWLQNGHLISAEGKSLAIKPLHEKYAQIDVNGDYEVRGEYEIIGDLNTASRARLEAQVGIMDKSLGKKPIFVKVSEVGLLEGQL